MATALMGGGQDAAVRHMVMMTAHVLRARATRRARRENGRAARAILRHAVLWAAALAARAVAWPACASWASRVTALASTHLQTRSVS